MTSILELQTADDLALSLAQMLVDTPDGIPGVLREGLSRMTGPRASVSPDSLLFKGRQRE